MQHDEKLGTMKLIMLSSEVGYHGTTILILILVRSTGRQVNRSTGLPTPFTYGWWAVVACVVQNETTANGTAFSSRLGIWIRCRVELKWTDASAYGKQSRHNQFST